MCSASYYVSSGLPCAVKAYCG